MVPSYLSQYHIGQVMESFQSFEEIPKSKASQLKEKLTKLCKPMIRIFIFSICVTVTGWQTVLCIEKYVTSPQNVNIDVQEVSKLNLLDITFCVPNSFNQTVLQECGIKDYFNQWSSKLCPDPQQLSEKVWLPSQHFIKSAIGTSRSRPPFKIQMFPFKNLQRTRPNCFTLPIEDPIDQLSLKFASQVTVYAHQKGTFNQDKGIEIDDSIDLDLSYEIIQKQKTDLDTCIPDESYGKTECIWDELSRQSLTAFGCTTPFGPSQHICRDRQDAGGQMALKMYNEYFLFNQHSCKDSCKTTLVHYDILKRSPEINIGVRINFPKQVKVFTTDFTYSFLSLMAEIGGHVGLFLGFSVMDILTIWTYFFRE